MLSYYWRVAKRAWADTYGFVKPLKVLYGFAVGVGFAVIADEVLGLGLEGNFWKVTALGIFVEAAAFVALYLGNLFLAPARLDRERVAEIGRLETTVTTLQRQISGPASPRIRVDIVSRELKHEAGTTSDLWGLQVWNDGASAVFHALLEVKAGMVSLGKSRRHVSFFHSKETRSRIATGAHDMFFFGRIDWDSLHKTVGAKALLYFDDGQERDREAFLQGVYHDDGGGGVGWVSYPPEATADVEITITAEPPMLNGPWHRSYRLGPEKLIELPQSPPQIIVHPSSDHVE